MPGCRHQLPRRPVGAVPGCLQERERWEWRTGESADPLPGLCAFLAEHGLLASDLSTPSRPPARAAEGAAVLIGAAACAAIGGQPIGAGSPAPGVPDLAVVAYQPGRGHADVRATGSLRVAGWQPSWSDTAHADAVRAVRAEIARGEVYQVNVVGHRSAPYDGDPERVLSAVREMPGAVEGGRLYGAGWAVASASPESLLRVAGGRVQTRPIKGTRPADDRGRRELLASGKERAEHVMIVDLERNDLGRIGLPGTVVVESMFCLREWSGLWQAESVLSATLRPGVGTAELLQAMLPGGSVTGAPKHAASRLIAALEPVGRGPSMGGLGWIAPGTIDLGLTIRTLAADDQRLHYWAGGGITWGSDPAAEVAEAHAKAGPVLAAISQVRPSRS